MPRTKAAVTRFFDGFELIEPGVAFLSQCRPTGKYYAACGTR